MKFQRLAVKLEYCLEKYLSMNNRFLLSISPLNISKNSSLRKLIPNSAVARSEKAL